MNWLNVPMLEQKALTPDVGAIIEIQSCHKNIIEEAAVTIAPTDTFEPMETAAVRLAKLVGYVSAGTEEFLYKASTDNFYSDSALQLMVNLKTCLIEQENDPTQLRSPSPGKVVRFLVESREHVTAGQPYAKIEVMKMYMPLLASEDRVPQFVKQPGVTLETGVFLLTGLTLITVVS
ncbi:hypothetical protein DFH28DRAFT_936115 [Melampsora americana]|nr:hypothetical protein DFH28DRAFT_936115 [Melampsora americana]